MIVRTTTEITDTDRDITSEDGNWRSKRIVLGGDRVGFSFHETTIKRVRSTSSITPTTSRLSGSSRAPAS